jgi:hypothetical protein
MMTCCTHDSLVINLTYSEQQVFSHEGLIKKKFYDIGHRFSGSDPLGSIVLRDAPEMIAVGQVDI